MIAFPAAPLDRGARVITLSAALVVSFVVAWGARAPGGLTGTLIVLIAGVGLLLLTWGYAPSAYRLGGGDLIIRRQLFGEVRFSITGDIVRTPATFGAGGIRVLGSGGFFGWYGTFWRPGSGRYTAYVTDRASIVACTTDRGIVLVSPGDPEAFVAAARKARQHR